MFMAVALIAALLGSPEVADTAAWMAKALFVVFVILTGVAFVLDRKRPA
jgi:uncharacterized membrane protein YtjA (UPF0391 family)